MLIYSLCSSKTVKATGLKFDVHVFERQSGHDPLKIFGKGGVSKNSVGGDMHSHERHLVIFCHFSFEYVNPLKFS